MNTKAKNGFVIHQAPPFINSIKLLPVGYYLLEYTPDDGRGFLGHAQKTPIIGMAHAFYKNEDCMFPVTARKIYFYEKDNSPAILFPCGGVQSGGDEAHDVFFDSLDDFIQAKEYMHKAHNGQTI